MVFGLPSEYIQSIVVISIHAVSLFMLDASLCTCSFHVHFCRSTVVFEVASTVVTAAAFASQ